MCGNTVCSGRLAEYITFAVLTASVAYLIRAVLGYADGFYTSESRILACRLEGACELCLSFLSVHVLIDLFILSTLKLGTECFEEACA